VITKNWWLAVAEIVDAFRVIPRIMLFGYGIFYYSYIMHVTAWYFTLPNPNVEATAFITGTITALGGMLTIFSNTYIKTGRSWGDYKGDL